MIKRLTPLLNVILMLVVSASLYAQTDYGIERFPLKEGVQNGLQKIKNGPYYGVYDANDRVLVSVEYAEFVFVDDIAILTKNDGTVYGYIKEDGEVHMFDEVYEFHPRFPFYWNGFLPVRKIPKVKVQSEDSINGRWIFIDESGNPIFDPRYNLKKININVRKPYTFYKVNTFSDGYAVVTTNQNQIIHIDKKGNRSFTLPKEENCYFRSSVNNGECVIITDDGVLLCQENMQTKEAAVKMVLVPYIAKLKTSTLPDSLSFDGGTLHFDLWGRTRKFVRDNGEEIYFIGEPPKEIELIDEPQPEFKFPDDIKVSLVNTVAEASERGFAAYAAKVANTSTEAVSDTLTVTIKSSGMKDKVETMVLDPGADKKITFYIPARFAEAQQKRNVAVIVSTEKAEIDQQFTVTAKRWQGDDEL